MSQSGPPRSSSFPPHIVSTTRLLILGSLPGQKSLQQQQYYAHPQNQFWRLTGAIIGAELASHTYDDRMAALTKAGIGLWDVVGSATRPGSLDSAIRDASANDLAGLVSCLPDLAAIAFNGATAFRLGAPLLADSSLPLLCLPSSSPAHAALRLADKQAIWLTLRDWL